MPGVSNGPHRVSPPWGLLGALVLALLVESWVHRHALDLTPPGATAFGFAGRASRESTHSELICLGDSLVKHGVAPRVLEARLGKRALNLACGGGTSPLTYFLLKRSLDAGARPSALLVDFKAIQLQSSPPNVERALVEVLDLAETLDLARAASDPALFARISVSRLLPSIRTRSEIRGWIVAAFRGQPRSIRQENLVVLRNWTVNRGAGLLEKNPSAESIAEHSDEKCHTASGLWFCDPVNAIYVKKFLMLAAARGIPVYWLLPPIHPRVQSRRDLLELDAGFNRMLRRATERYPNLTVVDGRGAGYPARHYVDATHLDSDGAYEYSDELASMLTRASSGRPDGPRWVTLPAYRSRPIAVPLENYCGSRVALSGGAKSPDTVTVPESRAIAGGDRIRR